jgi:hypothetical protein
MVSQQRAGFEGCTPVVSCPFGPPLLILVANSLFVGKDIGRTHGNLYGKCIFTHRYGCYKRNKRALCLVHMAPHRPPFPSQVPLLGPSQGRTAARVRNAPQVLRGLQPSGQPVHRMARYQGPLRAPADQQVSAEAVVFGGGVSWSKGTRSHRTTPFVETRSHRVGSAAHSSPTN